MNQSSPLSAFEHLQSKVKQQLQFIYAEIDDAGDLSHLTDQLLNAMRLDQEVHAPTQYKNHWTEKDTILITYGDSIKSADKKPLTCLKDFLDNHCHGSLNSVHILPFFPYSSDDGFSVINFASVNESLGDWSDINSIASEYKLMADLVINHCSARSQWFENFKVGINPGKDFFFTTEPTQDLTQVTRPRTSDLLREVKTTEGTKHVWCTFSHDQVDLNFRSTDLLVEMVGIIRHYLDMGVRIFRFDAIAFLWKKIGTNCINLPETHEVVRLLRTLVEHAQSDAVIITETNIPNRENLSYFGNANEAHCVYNFSLPPLLVNSLVSGSCKHLREWMMSMPPAQNGTAYFNFIASHDGIGLRPAEGLLNEEEINELITCMQEFGGKISWRAEGSKNKPYEINIALFDALRGTIKGSDEWQEARFLCAHAIMLGLEGIPGIYIHSMLATSNDYARVERTNNNRAINRHQWIQTELKSALEDEDSIHSRIFTRMKTLLTLRANQPAFHPNATQFTLHLGYQLFGFWRQSIDRTQSIFCIHNISDQPQTLSLSSLNLIETDVWIDLISANQIDFELGLIDVSPYQSLWITNTETENWK